MNTITKVTRENSYGTEVYYELEYCPYEPIRLVRPIRTKMWLHALKLARKVKVVRFNRLCHSQVYKYGLDLTDYYIATRHLKQIPEYEWVIDLGKALQALMNDPYDGEGNDALQNLYMQLTPKQREYNLSKQAKSLIEML